MHLSSGDIKLYLDSAVPNRLLLRYLTHFLMLHAFRRAELYIISGQCQLCENILKCVAQLGNSVTQAKKAGLKISAKDTETLLIRGILFFTFLLNSVWLQTTARGHLSWQQSLEQEQRKRVPCLQVLSVQPMLAQLSWALQRRAEGPGSWKLTISPGRSHTHFSNLWLKTAQCKQPSEHSSDKTPNRCVNTCTLRSFEAQLFLVFAKFKGKEKRWC